MTGQDIRAYRQRNKLTQAAFGALIGVSAGTVGDWERGKRVIPTEHLSRVESVMSRETKTTPVTEQAAKACKTCPYWRHMDGVKSKTMYCAHLQETGNARTCGVERTYQRYRALSSLSLDAAARAAELGMSYGQYKAMGAMTG